MSGQIILYDFHCFACNHTAELYRTYAERDVPELCPRCGDTLRRVPSPVYGRVRGRADGKDRNDADRFTADALGVKEHELPAGLRTTK